MICVQAKLNHDIKINSVVTQPNHLKKLSFERLIVCAIRFNIRTRDKKFVSKTLREQTCFDYWLIIPLFFLSLLLSNQNGVLGFWGFGVLSSQFTSRMIGMFVWLIFNFLQSLSIFGVLSLRSPATTMLGL